MEAETPNHPQVLCIDDDAQLLGMLGECLEQHGFAVSTGVNADDGMRLMDEGKADVLVLDVNLAGEDGIRLMTFLKTNLEKLLTSTSAYINLSVFVDTTNLMTSG